MAPFNMKAYLRYFVFSSLLAPALIWEVDGQTNTASPCAVDARMLPYPDVSANQITFVYAGDIWVATKRGGVAMRLSSPKGEESFPRFSPDGSQLAFTGQYDGNTEVYLMPSQGGIPKRLTYTATLARDDVSDRMANR